MLLPLHLPHRVRVLARLDVALADGAVHLVPDVVHEHAPVVQANHQKRRVLRMKVETHHAAVGGEGVLRMARVLERVAAYEPAHLLDEVEGAVPDGEEVVVLGVPRDGGDVPPLGALVVKLPQREQRPLTLAELIALSSQYLKSCAMSSYEFWFTMRSITFAAFVFGAPDMSSGFLGAGWAPPAPSCPPPSPCSSSASPSAARSAADPPCSDRTSPTAWPTRRSWWSRGSVALARSPWRCSPSAPSAQQS